MDRHKQEKVEREAPSKADDDESPLYRPQHKYTTARTRRTYREKADLLGMSLTGQLAVAGSSKLLLELQPYSSL